MTVLTGRLSSILGTPFGGPGYAVLIKSRMTRQSSGGSVILPLIDRIPMPAEKDGGTGEFTTSLLDPGPVRVELSGSDRHGDWWDITIPEGDGPFELADLIDAQTEWSPVVVSRAEAAARESREHADHAEASADRVGTAEQVGVWASEASASADRVGTAEQVGVWASEASASALESGQARDDAVTAAEDAVTAAEDAVTAREDAEQVATALPATIQSELDTRLPTELDTRLPTELDTRLPTELDTRVPPLVSAALADDPTIREAASIAAQNIALVEDPPGSGLFVIGA